MGWSFPERHLFKSHNQRVSGPGLVMDGAVPLYVGKVDRKPSRWNRRLLRLGRRTENVYMHPCHRHQGFTRPGSLLANPATTAATGAAVSSLAVFEFAVSGLKAFLTRFDSNGGVPSEHLPRRKDPAETRDIPSYRPACFLKNIPAAKNIAETATASNPRPSAPRCSTSAASRNQAAEPTNQIQ